MLSLDYLFRLKNKLKINSLLIPAVKFPGTVHVQASHSTLPVESVIVSPECPPTIVNDLANDFSQIKGGQPQAVLPQGGQGWSLKF